MKDYKSGKWNVVHHIDFPLNTILHVTYSHLDSEILLKVRRDYFEVIGLFNPTDLMSLGDRPVILTRVLESHKKTLKILEYKDLPLFMHFHLGQEFENLVKAGKELPAPVGVPKMLKIFSFHKKK